MISDTSTLPSANSEIHNSGDPYASVAGVSGKIANGVPDGQETVHAAPLDTAVPSTGGLAPRGQLPRHDKQDTPKGNGPSAGSVNSAMAKSKSCQEPVRVERTTMKANLSNEQLMEIWRKRLQELSNHENSLEKRIALTNLSELHHSQFRILGKIEDINHTIAYQSQLVMLTPEDNTYKPGRISNLGLSYHDRYKQFGNLKDIDKAVEYQVQAIQLTPEGHPDRPACLNNLSISYQSRFGHLGKLEDIDNAIECQIEAVQLTPNDHPDKPGRLGNVGDFYRLRFEQLGQLIDIDNAIHYMAQATLLAVGGSAYRSNCLNMLGLAYNRRFKRLGEIEDINKAIESQLQAVLNVPSGRLAEPQWLSNLGSSYRDRFERLGDLSDIDEAIKYQSQAAHLTPDTHIDKAGWLSNLGVSYMSRFERRGDLADIDRSVDCKSRAVALTPDGHIFKPGWLSNLGNSYWCRFDHTGRLEDLSKAIECQSQAVLLIPDGHPNKPSHMGNLGLSHMRRFSRLGEITDIDKAIDCYSQAVLLTPDGHAVKPVWLANLGGAYKRRFERLSEMIDIDNAVECHTRAILLTPDGDARKPGRLDSLGISYACRFTRLGRSEDIEKAIYHQRQAVLLCPDDHAEKSTLLNGLGNSYMRRFERCWKIEDVDQAIECHSQVVQLIPDGHPSKAGYLNNLGNSFIGRFEQFAELDDIEKAIYYQGQAVLLSPDGHADKSGMLCNLAVSHMRRFERLSEPTDAQTANTLFQQAAGLAITHPRQQFGASLNWARSCTLLGSSPRLAYERTMELVPQLIWLGSTINQRYTLLGEIGTVAMEAACWAISQKAYDCALEWLEEGRSVVWSQVLQLRTPFDELSTASPTLSQRLQEVSRELELASSRMTRGFFENDGSELEQHAQRHRRWAAEWDQLLDQARQLPGLYDFMRPRKAETLMTAARDGPIAVINVHERRCDALLILPNHQEIVNIPLQNFSQDKAHRAAIQLKSILQGGRSRGLIFKPPKSGLQSEQMFKTTLGMLWSDVVQPILDYLGYTSKKAINELPRITWCTTGSLSFLPLHAAGCYDGMQPNAFDLVVSSYTPTLGTLLSPTPQDAEYGLGLLAVGQASTDGLNDLPNTVHELAAIKRQAEAIRHFQLDGDKVTTEAFLKAMDEHSWVHLACHATQDASNPAHSAFHLNNGRLTLEAITKRAFKNKGLAFLSACQTAAGDSTLPDEAIHLAAGMLMAGYPSVIATMWSILDIDAPDVAKEVYGDLLEGGKMDCRGAARALHKSVAALRAKVGENSFMRWVPFIHMGM